MEVENILVDNMQFDCKTLINFSSLTQLLYQLSKKQNLMDDKIKAINLRIDEKEKRMNNVEIKLFGESKSQDNQIVPVNPVEDKKLTNEGKIVETNPKVSSTEEQPENSNENVNIVINQPSKGNTGNFKTDFQKYNQNVQQTPFMKSNEFSQFEGSKIEPIQFEPDEKSMLSLPESKRSELDPAMISKLYKKIQNINGKLNELVNKLNENINSLNDLKGKQENEEMKRKAVSQEVNELRDKLGSFNDEFEEVKVKVQDFNITELFDGKNIDGGDINMAKVLVDSLESKIKKKIALIDEKIKKNDKDVFKVSEDIKNNTIVVQGLKTTADKLTENLNNLKTESEGKLIKLGDNLSNINEDINNIFKKIEEEGKVKLVLEDLGKKIDENTKSISKLLSGETDIPPKSSRTVTKEEPQFGVDEIEEIKDSLITTKKLDSDVKEIFLELKKLDIGARLTVLEKDIQKKAKILDVNELSESNKSLQEYCKELSFKIDAIQQSNDKLKSEMSQVTKKIESLNGEYGKLLSLKFDKDNEKSQPIFDVTKFVDFSTFNEIKKEINIKFDKIRLGFEEFNRNLDEILQTLTHTPTDKDFSQYQTIVKNMMEEFKFTANKRFADKYEINKSIKFLEAQIKILNDGNKKLDGSENWLLAKKPMNNFQCASCESYIKGDLDKKGDFVAWNKYPNRDDKSYRMGHGFSRMLQMVNNDIMKTLDTRENKDSKGYSSDEENNYKKGPFQNYRKQPSNSDTERKENNNTVVGTTQSIKLPKVKNKNLNFLVVNSNTVIDNSPSNPYEENEVLNTDVENQPRVLKILKINRGSSPNKTTANKTEPKSQNNLKIISNNQYESEKGRNNSNFNFNQKQLPSEESPLITGETS